MKKNHLYCVGTGKSGTHSIAGIFKNYKVAHDPDEHQAIKIITRIHKGQLTLSEARMHIKEREDYLDLEVNSSVLNYFFLGELLSLFPDAKFILTIRDCYTWLDSVLNHQLSHPCPEWLKDFYEIRYRPNRYEHSKEDSILADCGLYSIEGYLACWAEHNAFVIQTVAKDRLLIVRTTDISVSLGRISDFVGVPLQTLDKQKTHLYPARTKYYLLDKIDSDFLAEKADFHCSKLMAEFFPDIISYDCISKHSKRAEG